MTLNDIRNKSGLVILVIGVAMLGFLLTDLFSSGTQIFQKNQSTLLTVGGEDVSIIEFTNELEEMMATGRIDPSQRNTRRDLLFDQKKEDLLFANALKQSGVHVGVDEIWDLISGEYTGNQSEKFRIFFSPYNPETNEQEVYSPELIEDWINLNKDIVNNPNWRVYERYKNDELRGRQISKYSNLIKKALYATKYDAQIYFKNKNQVTSGKYVYIPVAKELSSISISEKEIKQYYKNNKLTFSNSPYREINYFTFNIKPSDQDKNDKKDEMLALISDKNVFNARTNLKEIELGFENTDNIENFISDYGDNKYEIISMSKVDFQDFKHKKNIENNIIQPYFEKNVCKMGRIINTSIDSVDVVYLEMNIYPSEATLNTLYGDVYKIINSNKKIDDINKFSDDYSIRPREVKLEKMDESIPGLGLNREIVKWVFDTETNLYVPKFFELEDKYIIVVLSNILEDETKPIEMVYDDIKLILENRKKGSLLLDKIGNLKYNTLEELANHFDVEVKRVNGLSMNSDIFGDEGYHPDVVGAFFGSLNAKISDPIIANEGVFLINKEKENPINYPTSFNREQQEINNRYNLQVDRLLFDALQGDEEIVDNRFNFY